MFSHVKNFQLPTQTLNSHFAMVKFWTSLSVKELQIVLNDAKIKAPPKLRKADLVDLCCSNLQDSDLENYSKRFGKNSQMTPRSRSRKSQTDESHVDSKKASKLKTSSEKSLSPVLPENEAEHRGNNSDRRGRSVEQKNTKKRCPSLDASKAAREEMKQRRKSLSESQSFDSPPKARRSSLPELTDNFGNSIFFISSPKDSESNAYNPSFEADVEILSSESEESEESNTNEKRECVEERYVDRKEECVNPSQWFSIWKYGFGIVAVLAAFVGKHLFWENVPSLQRYCDGGSVALLNEEDQKIFEVASAHEFSLTDNGECIPCPLKGVCRNNQVACETNFKLHFGRNSFVSCIQDQEVYKIAFQLLDSVGEFLQQLETQRLCGEASSSAQTEKELRSMLESTVFGYEPRLFYNALNLLFDDILKDDTYLK
eukprot:GHVP01042295.1.p1 GENE.GHVP01042295.1~~GHVP01042295.1.p1  ORF type:complete len:429 (+),score=95.41 GHVP01042295.1:112-1398(+)